MAIKLSGSNIIDDNRNIVSAGVVTATRAVIGSGVTITSGGIHAVGLAITAASFSGDGSGLSNTGSTLSAASGSQRVVVTSQTSGTMTASSTDADLTFDANSNVLSVNGGLNVTGVATATSVRIGSAVTANSGGIRVAGVGTFTNVEGVNITSPYGGSLNLSNNHPSNGYKGGKVSAKKNVPWINDSIVPSPTIGGDAAIFNISIFDYQDTLTGQFFAIKDPAGDIDVFDAAAWCIQPSQTAWQNHQTWFRSSGNVGFGTTNPSSKVQVIGDVTATSFLTGASGSAIRVTSDTISGPATLNIDPAAVGDNTGTVVIKGDLQVDGTTTTVNSTTLTVDDKNIELGSTASPSDATADGGGITLKGTTDKTLNWVDATDSWTSSESVNLLTGKTYKIAGTDVLTASAVLGKSVPSGTIVGTTDSQTLSGKTLTAFGETVYSFGNTGTAATLALSNGNFVTATLNGNCTFTFSMSFVPSGAYSFTLVLANDGTGGRSITWPASVKWPNGTVPTRTTTANKTDVYTFFTYDGGTTWWGNLSLYNFS